jgi:hypothetical protein
MTPPPRFDSYQKYTSELLGEAELAGERTPVGRVGIERAVELERLADAHLLRQAALLQLHADELAQLRVARFPAEHPDRALVRGAQAATHSTVVVLPAPFGPRIPKISPGSTANETPSTASVDPYRFRRLVTSMTVMHRASHRNRVPESTSERALPSTGRWTGSYARNRLVT